MSKRNIIARDGELHT